MKEEPSRAFKVVPSARRLVRFGVFEADLHTGELRKNGARIRLPQQPFRILAMLLERPGEMVTREDIQRRLWLADTFVDFESGLNAAINRIRQALGDSAATPRFVETLPRRGYRFIAPVEDVRARVGPALESRPREARLRFSGPWAAPLALAAAFVTLGTLLWYFRPPLPAPRVLGYAPLTHDGRPKSRLLTDGLRLYFGETLANGRYMLASVPVVGGDPTPVPLPPSLQSAGLMDVLPSRSELLVGTPSDIPNQDKLWALPLPGSSPRRGNCPDSSGWRPAAASTAGRPWFRRGSAAR